LLAYLGILCLIAAWSGCATKQGPYNSQVVSIATDLQKTYTEFLVGIKVTGSSSPADYKTHLKTYYTKIYVALSQLDFYSDLPKNTGLKAKVMSLQSETATLQNADRESGLTPQFAENELGLLNKDFAEIFLLEISAQAVGAASASASEKPKPGG